MPKAKRKSKPPEAEPGELKFSICILEPLNLSDEQADALLSIPDADEVWGDPLYPYSVIFRMDIDKYTPEMVENRRQAVLDKLKQSGS